MKVWILVPAACDLVHASFSSCLFRLMGALRESGIRYNYVPMPGDSLVTRARNNLADIFLAESVDDNDFSLWLDQDILFDPQAVVAMLGVNSDFVVAPYTTKGNNWDRIHAAVLCGWPPEDLELVAGNPNLNGVTNKLLLDRPTPVMHAGSGFWLVKRKVFRIMTESLKIRYKRTVDEREYFGRGYAHDFFKVGIWPGSEEYLSEDWWFCRQWRELGGTIYLCAWIPTVHVGLYRYQMSIPEIARLLEQTGGSIRGPVWRQNGESQSAVRGNPQETVGVGQARLGGAPDESFGQRPLCPAGAGSACGGTGADDVERSC